MLSRLRNKHVVFIGDSLLRYQFRSLLYSLHYGHTVTKVWRVSSVHSVAPSRPCCAAERACARPHTVNLCLAVHR